MRNAVDVDLIMVSTSASVMAHLHPAASASQINLTWTDNSTNEQGFRIEL